jgi:hypothetical protein
MTSYEALYEGSSFLIPRYNPAGYQELAKNMGMSLDPRTANQLKEVNVKINPGIKHVELSGIQGQILESIPDEHLDEIRRLTQLTGVTTSLHAPIVEASGIGQRGWEEVNRLGAEKQLESALLRSKLLDPQGNISVVVHSSAGLPEMSPKIKIEERNPVTGEIEEKEKPTSLFIVDQSSGKFGQIEPEKRFFPEEGEGKFSASNEPRPFDPEKELAKRNRDIWTQQLSEVNRFATYGEEIIDRATQTYHIPEDMISYISKGEDINNLDEDDPTKKVLKAAQRDLFHGQIYLRDSYRHFRDLFDKAWLSGGEHDRDKLKKFADHYAKEIVPGIETNPEKLPILKDMMEEGLRVLRDIEAPKTFIPMQEFAIKKTAETFANAATTAWEKFHDKAPVLNIENPPAGGEGGGLSRAEDLRDVVKATRQKFIQNLVDKGVDHSTAEEAAKKTIGATWDVGHINMLRKKGYSEKDIIKQTEIIAPYVKHVHLSDNFGLDHTELPMGMGNVPMKEIMEKLKKEGFKGKEIIEAGNWWQHFAEQGGGNPFKPTLQNYDSPVYAMKEGYTWSQLGGYAGYFSGHGPVNPSVHHNLYGSGFQNLPVELGGEIPGTRDRMSGTPMQ